MPNKNVEFLPVDEVLEIYRASCERFGGGSGVRDAGLLESALFRPRTGHYADIVGMAAALFESLLISRPFLDGNKRTAFFATDVFLRLNGYRIAVDARRAHALIVGSLERGEADFARLTEGLRQRVVKNSSE